MYCIKCGAELSEDSKFCFNCGVGIKKKENLKKRNSNGSKRSIFVCSVTILGVVIVLIASMFVYKIFMLKNDTDTVSEVVAGKKSVDDLGDLVGYENVDSYIEAATACVERGDLYGAKNILETGYSDTRDDSLLNVSIWGPLSCYDNVLITEEFPVITTCEYVFSNDKVIGKINFLETSAVRIEYFFSSTEERLIGEVITVYDMTVAGVDSKADEILQQDVYYCFDCLYNEKGEVVALVDAYGQEEVATMEYENGRCVSVDFMEKYHFQYDENGQITSITIPDSDYDSQMLFEYDPDGSYTVRGPAGMNSDFFGSMDEKWELSVDKRGFLQELIVGEERIIEVEFGERGEILHSNGFMDDHYGSGKQLGYEYNENGDICRVLIFETDSGSSQEDHIEAEVTYSYDSKNRMTDIVYNNFDGTDTKSVYRIWSYHIDYDQNGRGVRIEETDIGDQKTIYEISYSDDGKIEAIKGEADKEIYVHKYEYDTYGRWMGIIYVSEDDEQDEKLDESDNAVVSETSPYRIIGSAKPRLYLIAYEYPWDQFLYAYLVLEEGGSGEINVVSLPCETVLYSTNDTVKMVCDFTSPNELLVALNENYDLTISDYVSIAINDLLSEVARQSGYRLDLGTIFTSGEIEEISSALSTDANNELMLKAWNKVLDKQELSPEDLVFIGDIFAQKQISQQLRKKFGEALFSLFAELPDTSTVFETVYTSYDEDQFIQDCSVNYEEAYIGTAFADQKSMESMGGCYYPEDAAAFASQVQYFWSGNTNYIPSETVNDIAARMKEIYAEEVEN